MGVFLVTATWSEAGGLSYYENGKLVVSTQSFNQSSISENFKDVITVGYEETSSGKLYSSLIIYDLMIWNRALSSDDVDIVYTNGKQIDISYNDVKRGRINLTKNLIGSII